MSYWRAKFPNDYDEYEITFASKCKEKTKIVEDVCKAIIDKKVNSIEDISIGNTSPRWIPVTERLPKERDGDRKGRVFAVLKGEDPKVWHWSLVADYSDNFTHWMPLPKPPEDGGAENA